MASSRWKRFAFFEKQALSLPTDVLNDLIPKEASSGRAAQNDESLIWDDVSMVVSTASLPINSRPSEIHQQSQASFSASSNIPRDQQQPQPQEEVVSLTQMWASLAACASLASSSDVADGSRKSSVESGEQQQKTSASTSVNLSSQSQSLHGGDRIGISISEEALDGLVLVFTASQSTPFIHCFDLTVRCNPPAFPNDTGIRSTDTKEVARVTECRNILFRCSNARFEFGYVVCSIR